MSRTVKRNLLIVGSIVLAVLLIDQCIKIWAKGAFIEMMPNGRLSYDQSEIPVFGDWFKILYIENQGMAFGTTFGASMWAKLGLSIFRIVAIIGIGYYWFKQAQKGMKTELLIAIGFIFAGATGNLIDSMVYDFIFPYDGCLPFNHLEGSGVYSDCGIFGRIETRHTGFLLGNVVDMFQFDMTWPQWVPWVGGNQVFPAIWNIADGSITVGVLMILFRQRAYFKKKKKQEDQPKNDLNREAPTEEAISPEAGATAAE